MSKMKDLYIIELERIAAELECRGVPPERAYAIAGQQAYDSLKNRWRTQLDNEPEGRWRDKD